MHNRLVGSRTSKRLAGQVRNIANQLAQIAVVFEASFDGPVLLAEGVETGHYVLDLIHGTSRVNGHDAKLGIASLLEDWIQGELVRLDRERTWLTGANVLVEYTLTPSGAYMDSHEGFWTSLAIIGTLSATVSITTADGTARASFENVQALIGRQASPIRPMPSGYPELASNPNVVAFKRGVRREPPEGPPQGMPL
jgi:hypothetical protein